MQKMARVSSDGEDEDILKAILREVREIREDQKYIIRKIAALEEAQERRDETVTRATDISTRDTASGTVPRQQAQPIYPALRKADDPAVTAKGAEGRRGTTRAKDNTPPVPVSHSQTPTPESWSSYDPDASVATAEECLGRSRRYEPITSTTPEGGYIPVDDSSTSTLTHATQAHVKATPAHVKATQAHAKAKVQPPCHSPIDTHRPRGAEIDFTKKHIDFVREPMGDKGVTILPGIGPSMAKKLNDHGITKARQVHAKFVELDGETGERRFIGWMMNIIGVDRRYATDCFNGLHAKSSAGT